MISLCLSLSRSFSVCLPTQDRVPCVYVRFLNHTNFRSRLGSAYICRTTDSTYNGLIISVATRVRCVCVLHEKKYWGAADRMGKLLWVEQGCRLRLDEKANPLYIYLRRPRFNPIHTTFTPPPSGQLQCLLRHDERCTPDPYDSPQISPCAREMHKQYAVIRSETQPKT